MADNRSLDLVSWRPGPTRAALETFIAESVAAVAPTLWCEKPMCAQLDFFIDELTPSAHHRPELADVPEYSALLAGDTAAVADNGQVVLARTNSIYGEREYAYEGTAATFESSEPSTDTATRLGRKTVSMRRDWDRIFPAQ